MKGISIEEQCIIDLKDTVRGASEKFGISKSTVHTDVTFQNYKQKESLFLKVLKLKEFS